MSLKTESGLSVIDIRIGHCLKFVENKKHGSNTKFVVSRCGKSVGCLCCKKTVKRGEVAVKKWYGTSNIGYYHVSCYEKKEVL